MDITNNLLSMADEKFKAFNASLVPNIAPEAVIGVKTPPLRKMAKELYKAGEYKVFLQSLPHRYFEENQLHAFIISEMRDAEECIAALEEFLPYVDNWATCDQMAPKILAKDKKMLAALVEKWIVSPHTYTIRFAVNMLMKHFLDDDFEGKYPAMVEEIHSEEYYVNMVRAWYFATALAKQREDALLYITERRLDKWTHNKAIQKAIESRRISPEDKELLRKYKI